MLRAIIALLGDLDIDRAIFDPVAEEFGWAVECAGNLSILREMSSTRNIAAVVFDHRTSGGSWNEALELVLLAAPRALPIVGAGFSEDVPMQDLCDAGAFDQLRLPVNEREVRRTLGFVWAARRTHDAEAAHSAAKRDLRTNPRTAAALKRFFAKG
jgi:DNA-binding NtrC family response regulator